MAVSFSNAQYNNVTVAATTNSFSYNAAGASYLVIHVATTSTTLSTGATFNGIAMTNATNNNSSFTSEIYYLSNPPQGSYTLTVTWAGTQQSLVTACCVNNANGIGVASSSTGGITTTPQVTMTTTGTNSGIFVGLSSNLGTSVTDIGTQNRLMTNNSWGSFYEFDSWALEPTAGSHTYGYTQSSTQGCVSAIEFKNIVAITDNIISYWKLDASNSSDSVGTNNCTDTSTSYGAGLIGNCPTFNGTSSFIQTARNSSYEGLTAMTINAWINTGSTKSSNIIFGKGTYTSNVYHWSYMFGLNIDGASNGKMGLQLYQTDGSGTSSAYIDPSATTCNDSAWHMVTVQFVAGKSVSFYKDGTFTGQYSTSIYSTMASNTFTGSIGSDNNTQFAKNYFSGKIDEVAIWNRILSPTEIAQLYNGGKGLAYPLSIAAKFNIPILQATNRASTY